MVDKKDLPVLDKDVFLCCDPGSGGTGFALFSKQKLFPLNTHVVSPPQNIKQWATAKRLVLLGVEDYLEDLRDRGCQQLYIEKPQFMDTHVGITAARSDNLLKLIVIYSCIGLLAERLGYVVKDVKIPTWKGQLDKRKVSFRLEKILGATLPDHIADAVGIGLFLKGKFTIQQKD